MTAHHHTATVTALQRGVLPLPAGFNPGGARLVAVQWIGPDGQPTTWADRGFWWTHPHGSQVLRIAAPFPAGVAVTVTWEAR